ncbi:hypothetical protein [Asanoa sp. NPDC050611]|uniref:hypothetical protein n=1 Tax=Asanoa sp. NPDC050611 TaxID=3157098 RepID=UPI0033FAF608
MSDRLGTVALMWQAHLRAPFPRANVGAVEMVMVDADIAGCVSVWLDNGGHLDAGRRSVLADRLDDLDAVLPLLAGHARDYYRRLRDLAELIKPGN